MTRSRVRLCALFCIVVLAAALRLFIIDRDALWLDEGYSWWDARQPFASLWTLVPQCDPHPPLYFALLHAWIAGFGDGTFAMRALSALFGTATVAVVYLAGRELDDARGKSDRVFGIGILAALLFSLTPFQIYFAIEARPYSLLCLGAALLTMGSLKLIKCVTPSGWLALVAGAVIVVWTNNTAVLLLSAVSVAFIGLWLFDRSTRVSIGAVIAAGAVVALLWAPDLPLLISQMHEVSQEFWIPAPTLQGLTYELHYLIGLDSTSAVWWMVLAMSGGLVLIGRRIAWKIAAMVAALVILPVIFNVAISAAFKPILIARALIVVTPAISLALAAAVVLIGPRWLRVIFAIVMIAAHTVAAFALLRADHVKEPWKIVVAELTIAARDQVVLVVPNEMALPLSHEADVQHLHLRLRGVPADFPATDMQARYPSGKCAPSIVGQDLVPLIDSLRAEPAVTLLTRSNNTYDPDEAIAKALRVAGFQLQRDDVFQPGDLRVMRFARDSKMRSIEVRTK